ncbi:MAG: alcohol dehydrogenase catalytic domain-containing protein [Rhodoblastus sp.]
MKAFILDRYGKKQTLRLGEMSAPQVAPDEVLVEVKAAGLNLLDSKIRDGAFKLILPYKPPLVLGHDLAGVAERI